MSTDASHPYDDIIDLPHHVSATRPRMPMTNRAAQFSPFAALSGYEAAIEETGRLTDPRIELAEDSRGELDRRQQVLMEHLEEQPRVSVTYFVPDGRKSGGSYKTVTGQVTKIDLYRRRMVLENGTVVDLEDVIALESDLFHWEL